MEETKILDKNNTNKDNDDNDKNNDGNDKDNRIMLFTSTKCKMCEAFKPEWIKFLSEFEEYKHLFTDQESKKFIQHIIYDPSAKNAIEKRKEILKYAKQGKDGYPLLLFYIDGKRWKPYWFDSNLFRTSRAILYSFLIHYVICSKVNDVYKFISFMKNMKFDNDESTMKIDDDESIMKIDDDKIITRIDNNRKIYDGDNYDKKDYDRENYGRQNYGRQNYGRQNYGREDYGREDYGREDYGREDYYDGEDYDYGCGKCAKCIKNKRNSKERKIIRKNRKASERNYRHNRVSDRSNKNKEELEAREKNLQVGIYYLENWDKITKDMQNEFDRSSSKEEKKSPNYPRWERIVNLDENQ